MTWGFPGGSLVKNHLKMQEMGFDPWVGRSPGEGNGNPLQESRLKYPMDSGAWWVTVHIVTNSLTRPSK